jgi:hypothetical protein
MRISKYCDLEVNACGICRQQPAQPCRTSASSNGLLRVFCKASRAVALVRLRQPASLLAALPAPTRQPCQCPPRHSSPGPGRPGGSRLGCAGVHWRQPLAGRLVRARWPTGSVSRLGSAGRVPVPGRGNRHRDLELSERRLTAGLRLAGPAEPLRACSEPPALNLKYCQSDSNLKAQAVWIPPGRDDIAESS